MKKIRLIIIYLLLSLSWLSPQPSQAERLTQSTQATATPSATPTPASVPTLSPSDIAQAWLSAVVNQDEEQLLNLTCAARQDEVQGTSPWLLAFPALEDSEIFKFRLKENPEMDISQLRFEGLSSNDAQVRVHVKGRLQMNSPDFSFKRGSGPGFSLSRRIEAQWWLVQEAGLWRWCGAIRGEATPTPKPSPTARSFTPVQSATASPGIWGCLNGFLGIIFGLLLPLLIIISQWVDYLNKKKSKM